jgi:hypothetical protein
VSKSLTTYKSGVYVYLPIEAIIPPNQNVAFPLRLKDYLNWDNKEEILNINFFYKDKVIHS